MQTMFSVMATDPSPTCGFLEVFRDESKHHAGDNKDEDEEDTNQDGILPHSSINGLVLVVHVWVCVCVWVVNV